MARQKLTSTEKRIEALKVQTEKNKAKLLEQLQKYPIVQVACERSGIGRATYYKWREDDLAFKKAADAALQAGTLFINDLAESRLIKNIQDGQSNAISFWLRNHHTNYMDSVRYQHHHFVEIQEDKHNIDPETIALIKKAMYGFATKVKKNKEAGIGPHSFDPNYQKKKSTEESP